MEYGFVKVASAVPTVKVADCRHNAGQMAEMIAERDDGMSSTAYFTV